MQTESTRLDSVTLCVTLGYNTNFTLARRETRNQTMPYTLKQKLGAMLFDVPRYLYYLSKPAKTYAWTKIKNRGEVLSPHGNQPGVECQWQWTSDLYLPDLMPRFGRALFRKSFEAFPLDEENQTLTNESADVTFIIGHRGLERKALLLRTLESIKKQIKCNIACIVVEQDTKPRIKDSLPDWVTHVLDPITDPATPYCRSKTFNLGVRHARSECLILHDNDFVVPAAYAYEVQRCIQQGYEFVNLKRFMFYLSQATAEKVCASQVLPADPEFDSICQNLEGGGSIGVSKSAFNRIGGFDERFIGWGGEDNEFWERAQTGKVWNYGYLPLIHLWHAPQAEKHNTSAPGLSLYSQLSNIPAEQRIKELSTAYADKYGGV